MRVLLSTLVACLSAAILSACGASGGAYPLLSPASDFKASPVDGRFGIDSSGSHLYVLNRGTTAVTVYAPPKKRVRTISQGLTSPWQLAFDGSGNLYVANIGSFSSGPYEVTVYAPGQKRPNRTISQDVFSPSALAFDGSGNLYVANLNTTSGGSDVTVYASGGSSPMETISSGVANPWALAFDGSGNLYVANDGRGSQPVSSVTVYAPGSTSVSYTIEQGVNKPRELAFDASGNLYVSNCAAYCGGASGEGDVTVYGPGSTSVLRTISKGLDNPFALAFDSSGNLYVANFGCPSSSCSPLVPSTVTVYAPGGTSTLRTISKEVIYPAALAFDGSGNLYVGNDGCPYPSCNPSIPSSVTVYAPGSKKPLRKITNGVSFPNSLAFGP